MKYIEELTSGDCFIHKDLFYIVTSDYKKNGSKLCYNLKDGTPLWLSPQDTVDETQIYTLDLNNNIVAIKPTVSSHDKI